MIHIATSMVNRHLKDIANDLGLPPITTYTARYTWASLALGIDTSIEVISQALGHSYGMAVTLGYIVRLMWQLLSNTEQLKKITRQKTPTICL